MSFLTRTALRTTSLSSARFAPRAFSTSPFVQKSVTETVKDAADTVNKKTGEKLVDGIEIGRMYPFLPFFLSCVD